MTRRLAGRATGERSVWRLAVCLCLVAGVAVTASSPAPSAAQPQAGAIISGRVVDAGDGSPIAGAVVTVRSTSPAAGVSVLTGRDGRFRLDRVPPGRVVVLAEKPGYLAGGPGSRRPVAGRPVTTVAGAPAPDLEIRLWRAAIISGRVTSPDDSPLPELTVEAVRAGPEDPNAAPMRARYTTRTNDLGEYEFDELLPGTYRVLVPVTHVTWASGTRRPQVRIVAPRTGRVLTDDHGRFSMRITTGSLPPPAADGREMVFVTTAHPDSRSLETAVAVTVGSGEARANVDVRMQVAPRVRIRGTAIGPTGPAAQTVIRLRRPGVSNDYELAQAETQADGRFDFLSAPPGDYVLEALRRLGDGHSFRPDPLGLGASMPLSVGDTDIHDLVVPLQMGGTLRAALVFDGAPADRSRGISVSLVPDEAAYPGATGQQVTGSNSYTAEGVVSGRYLIAAHASSEWHLESVSRAGRNVTGVPIDVRGTIDDLVITFTDRPAAIAGAVTAGVSGDDPSTAYVLLYPADPARRHLSVRGPMRPRASQVEGGRFAFEQLPVGDYLVVAVPDEIVEELPSLAVLERLAPVATRVTVGRGERRDVSLQVVRR